MKNVLALDFGASGGRAIVGSYDGEVITLTETHRFENIPVTLNTGLCWDIPALMEAVKAGLKKSSEAADIESVGIDTWGVDFGLIGFNGELLENPAHYRDGRTDGIPEDAFKVLAKDIIYSRTGIQVMQINTLYQFLYLAKHRPGLLEKTDKILFMPDLLAYLLTGVKKTEYTIASTSQMLNPFTRDWDYEMLETLGIPARLLCPIYEPPYVSGPVLNDIRSELSIKGINMVSVASHDTASAVLAVPANTSEYAYISSGTWSLFGTETKSPIVNKETEEANFTNEGGIGGKIRFLKNIMGLWLIQEMRREYNREGYTLSYSEIEKEASEAEAFKFHIDPDSIQFLKPGGMRTKIQAYCEESGQPGPQTRGEAMRCIYESLAMKYKYTLAELERLTGVSYKKIHVVGGGVQSALLCQMTADACGLPVVAGPVEATALGNIAAQFIANGVLRDIPHARDVIRKSSQTKVYTPQNSSNWETRYNEYSF